MMPAAAKKHRPDADLSDAAELIARMKRDGLVTQTRDGRYKVRSYGRAAFKALSLIILDEVSR